VKKVVFLELASSWIDETSFSAKMPFMTKRPGRPVREIADSGVDMSESIYGSFSFAHTIDE
jgi:hypothetical protein